MSRLIIISNRLPFSIDQQGDKTIVRQSSGGLVSAIKSFFENDSIQSNITSKLWMGVADFPQNEWDSLENEMSGMDFDCLLYTSDAADE